MKDLLLIALSFPKQPKVELRTANWPCQTEIQLAMQSVVHFLRYIVNFRQPHALQYLGTALTDSR